MDEQQKQPPTGSRKPVKVLSTSLGVALAANMLLTPGLYEGASVSAAGEEPTLVEWSTEAVKSYFNPSVDWSLQLPQAGQLEPGPTEEPGGSSGSGGGSGGSPVIIHNGGFGWDDLLLYHLLFNRGGSYSSGSWHKSKPVYDPRTKQPYQPKTYSSGTFQNRTVPGSNVKPKTSVSTGTFNTKGSTASKSSSSSSSGVTSSSSSSSSSKSTSSSSGSIGGKSSGFSSSSGS